LETEAFYIGSILDPRVKRKWIETRVKQNEELQQAKLCIINDIEHRCQKYHENLDNSQ
jgi:hypothetical protein